MKTDNLKKKNDRNKNIHTDCKIRIKHKIQVHVICDFSKNNIRSLFCRFSIWILPSFACMSGCRCFPLLCLDIGFQLNNNFICLNCIVGTSSLNSAQKTVHFRKLKQDMKVPRMRTMLHVWRTSYEVRKEVGGRKRWLWQGCSHKKKGYDIGIEFFFHI